MIDASEEMALEELHTLKSLACSSLHKERDCRKASSQKKKEMYLKVFFNLLNNIVFTISGLTNITLEQAMVRVPGNDTEDV